MSKTSVSSLLGNELLPGIGLARPLLQLGLGVPAFGFDPLVYLDHSTDSLETDPPTSLVKSDLQLGTIGHRSLFLSSRCVLRSLHDCNEPDKGKGPEPRGAFAPIPSFITSGYLDWVTPGKPSSVAEGAIRPRRAATWTVHHGGDTANALWTSQLPSATIGGLRLMPIMPHCQTRDLRGLRCILRSAPSPAFPNPPVTHSHGVISQWRQDIDKCRSIVIFPVAVEDLTTPTQPSSP